MMHLFTIAMTLVGSFYYGEFLEDSRVTVFRPETPLMARATTGSDTLSLLPAGGGLTVLNDTDGVCRVVWLGDSGFVRVVDLALASVEMPDVGLFQVGITGFDENLEPVGEARITGPDGSVLSCPVNLRPYSEFGVPVYTIEAVEEPAEGLAGVEAAIMVRFVYEACGYTNRDILFVSNGDALISGPDAASVSEAGIFSHLSSMSLPADDGEDDVVTVTTRHREWVEDGEDLILTMDEESLVRYSWNGSFFELEP
jgi:hypothetical protein